MYHSNCEDICSRILCFVIEKSICDKFSLFERYPKAKVHKNVWFYMPRHHVRYLIQHTVREKPTLLSYQHYILILFLIDRSKAIWYMETFPACLRQQHSLLVSWHHAGFYKIWSAIYRFLYIAKLLNYRRYTVKLKQLFCKKQQN